MGKWSLLQEHIVHNKTRMGLQQFEVENYWLEKNEAYLLAQEGIQSKNPSVRLKAYS